MRICPKCNRVFYLLRERHIVRCYHCGYNLLDTRNKRVRVDINFTFSLEGKKKEATIVNYSDNGIGIVYRGEPLPVNTIINLKVNDLKIQKQAKTVWTKEIGRLKAATGFKFLQAGILKPTEEGSAMKYLMEKSSCIRVLAFILIPLFNLINPSSVLSLDANMSPGKIIVPRVSEYIIGPEDVLDISVWKNVELSKTVTVRPDGMISLPLIGDIKAAELTPDKLRNAIAAKLKEYQNEAVVSVILHETNSNKVFILGEVARPGTYILKRKTTFLQAIALAGGFTQFASKNKIVVVRQKADDGKEEKMIISFDDIIDINSKSDKNILLRPGDTIFVP